MTADKRGAETFEDRLLVELLAIQVELRQSKLIVVPMNEDSGKCRRRRRSHSRGLIIGTGLLVSAVASAGVAAAVVLSAPTAQQSNAIKKNFFPDGGKGLDPGAKPALSSEMVLCDYRGLSDAPTSLLTGPNQAHASVPPLTSRISVQDLVDACVRPSTETQYVVPSTVPAHVCATVTSNPTAPAGWPVIVFGSISCEAAGVTSAKTSLIDEVNARRNLEASIISITNSCPTEPEANAWVENALRSQDVKMDILIPTGPTRASCYLPSVHWGPRPGTAEPWVEISPSSYPSP